MDSGSIDYERRFETLAGENCSPFRPEYHTPLGEYRWRVDLTEAPTAGKGRTELGCLPVQG
jgi:hypothetical protein